MQVLQSYIVLSMLLSVAGAVSILVFNLYVSYTRHSGGQVQASHFTLANFALSMSLLTQGVLSLLISLLLAWSYAQKRGSTFGLYTLGRLTELRFFGFDPHLSLDLFGSFIICLAFFIGALAIIVSDTRLKLESTPLFAYFQFFVLIVYGFVTIQDSYMLFVFYELLLLPSFFFVLFGSYTNKAVQAALYFVIWTQVGSFLVFIAICYMNNLVGCSDLYTIRSFKFKPSESAILYALFFFGFGIKVPIWPFHYWLTKTHVEAPSGFSIYLSGFLVKTALYGFFKVTNLFCFEGLTLLYAVIAIVGTVDASLKMWGQSDLKKMVAYCTVQEMNMIFLLFLLGDSNCTTCGALFSIAHAFLSALMFFLVDCIYRRFHTRSVFAIQGLLSLTPNLAMAIFIMCVLYAGLPGTVKFTCELGLLMALSEGGLTPVMIILFFANIIGLVGFSKSWFNVIFGLPSKELNRPVADLSLKEAMIIIYIILCFVLLNGFGILVI